MNDDPELEARAVEMIHAKQESMENETGVIPDQLVAAVAVIEGLIELLEREKQ